MPTKPGAWWLIPRWRNFGSPKVKTHYRIILDGGMETGNPDSHGETDHLSRFQNIVLTIYCKILLSRLKQSGNLEFEYHLGIKILICVCVSVHSICLTIYNPDTKNITCSNDNCNVIWNRKDPDYQGYLLYIRTELLLKPLILFLYLPPNKWLNIQKVNQTPFSLITKVFKTHNLSSHSD